MARKDKPLPVPRLLGRSPARGKNAMLAIRCSPETGLPSAEERADVIACLAAHHAHRE